MTKPIDLEAIKRKHAADDATAWAPHTWTHIHRGQLIAEVERLHAMVAELERDAARLDWLDRMNSGLNRYYGTDYGWRLILSPNVTRLMAGRHDNGFVGDIDLHDSEGSNARCRSCRNAIDAAMSEGER